MKNKPLLAFKYQTAEIDATDDFQVEYEVFPAFDIESFNPRKAKINQKIAEIDRQSAELNAKIDALNTEIERLTNHADSFDYAIAVGAGVLCGLIDSVFVGEFDFEKAKGKSHRQVNEFITKFAKMNGYEGERLDGAIRWLEKEFPVDQDNIWKGADIGVSAKNHHLADLAHHPTLIGLGAAIIVQFFRVGGSSL